MIKYELIQRGRKGLLLEDMQYITPICGQDAELFGSTEACRLEPSGRLTVFAGFVWDFGSGPAIDTPSVVRASLAHDALCLLTNRRLIPWRYRAVADAFYRDLLKQYGTSMPRRWWHWAGVRAYSEMVARWRDRL
jgi:hypothetical protein